jgi:phosphoglycolate phosphatase
MPRLGVPQTLFFDWHGTLADTFVAMYRAVEEMLPQLGALGLEARLLPPEVKHARRISRTEIFEILFGADADQA